MATPLPILYAGDFVSQVKYGFIRSTHCATNVQVFGDGQEQRSVAAPPLVTFTIPLNALIDSDRLKWIGASGIWLTTKGRFAQNVQITLGSTVYDNLTFMSDSLTLISNRNLQYDQQVVLRQVLNYPFTTPTVDATYPNLKIGTGSDQGINAELPFTQVSSYLNMISDSPFGQRFGRVWYDGSFLNFPTSYLRSWRIVYGLLDDTDASTIENYFLGQSGRWGSFTFEDQVSGDSFAGVRFDSDTLSRRFLAPNQSSITVDLRQTFI